MADRTYTDREIAAILSRAADGQRRGLDRDGTPGLTLDEIERAGAEAGIDPALVRRAAADLDAGGLHLDIDRPGTVVVERWADAPFRLAVWEDAVAALQVRHGTGTTTAPATADASREWTHTAVTGARTTVTASPRGDRTRIRVVTVDGGSADPRWQSVALSVVPGLALGMFAGWGVAEGLGWGDLAGVVAVLLTVTVAVAVGTPLLVGGTARRRARQAAEAERVADDLARALGGEAATEGPDRAGETAVAGGRLDLDALGEAPDEHAPARTGRRTGA